MIQHVYEQSIKSKKLSTVIVATDDERIYRAVKQFGGKVVMTATHHLNGTSRCAEVMEEMILQSGGNSPYDFLINIQGDEPMIHPEQIDEFADLFKDTDSQIVTQAKVETDPEQWKDNDIVKVILDENSFALDFNRIYEPETGSTSFYKHIGLYGFRIPVLMDIISLESSKNELERKLEQMRWLDNGYKIKVGITQYESLSIDNQQDLAKVRTLLNL